jgi:hypothetical protein
MKKSIKWHLDCLENQKKFLDKKQDELKRLSSKVNEVEKSIAFKEYQINMANEKGLKEFDPDRFQKKEKENFLNEKIRC